MKYWVFLNTLMIIKKHTKYEKLSQNIGNWSYVNTKLHFILMSLALDDIKCVYFLINGLRQQKDIDEKLMNYE